MRIVIDFLLGGECQKSHFFPFSRVVKKPFHFYFLQFTRYSHHWISIAHFMLQNRICKKIFYLLLLLPSPLISTKKAELHLFGIMKWKCLVLERDFWTNWSLWMATFNDFGYHSGLSPWSTCYPGTRVTCKNRTSGQKYHPYRSELTNILFQTTVIY